MPQKRRHWLVVPALIRAGQRDRSHRVSHPAFPRQRVARPAPPLALLLPLLLLLSRASTPVADDGDSSGKGAASAAAVNEMVSWLEESGAELSAVSVGTGAGGERGVHAARDFAPGETILRGTPCAAECATGSYLRIALPFFYNT